MSDIVKTNVLLSSGANISLPVLGHVVSSGWSGILSLSESFTGFLVFVGPAEATRFGKPPH